ncbi:MAG: Crp/Fnr family transcriptional regulator [Alphaproteobacteria bacterium]|nr:Crp/Fnr family transcriptional regulator [Alphaproteobacteria bacterium]
MKHGIEQTRPAPPFAANDLLPDYADAQSASAIFLSEALSQINEGAQFLDRLSLEEINAVRRVASPIDVQPGECVFMQGDQHRGIFLIESGQVRIYYAGPNGKEITLAYWTPGHFIGGPEVFGGGLHVWSATAVERSRLAYLPGTQIRYLAETVPAIALALIDGLVAKGRCYSALAQMLGTRSVTERLAQILLILAAVDGHSDGGKLVVDRRITHEQLAMIVGSTRQWVTSTLARLQKSGHISVDRNVITIEHPESLRMED